MNFPIDLVYLWCDSNDPEWSARKAQYATPKPQAEDEAGECRYFSNDELRYSLRSICKNAPWIHHIFIVTDRQCPKWLNTSDERISIVDHSDIIPNEFLPVFNSAVIENWIFRIPGLSEHFLYANDDMFIAQSVKPSFFFDDKEGRPIVRLKHQKLGPGRGGYQDRVRHMQELIEKDFHVRYHLAPHHNIDSYCRSQFEECLYHRYHEQLITSSSFRFRSPDSLHRSVVGYYMLATGGATMRKNSRYAECESLMERIKCLLSGHYKATSRCLPLCLPDYQRVVQKYNPILFALNDDSRTTPDDRAREHDFMERLFPTPSPFELP